MNNNAIYAYYSREHIIQSCRLDKLTAIVYTVFSDRVTDTCEACDQGSSCGDSLLFYGGLAMQKKFLSLDEQINYVNYFHLH